MTKAYRIHAVNTRVKQTGFDNFQGDNVVAFAGGCALAAIASAPANIIKC